MPATAAEAAPVAKASALYWRTSMPTSGAVCGLDRDGAHGAAGRGVAQEREHGARQHQGGDHHDQAVVLDRGAEHVERFADEVAVLPVVAGPGHQGDALQQEQEAEGGEDGIHLALAGIGGARQQRMQHVAEQQPAQPEGGGNAGERRDERREPELA